MGILDGKRILVTGVLTDASIGFHVAKIAQQEGATVILTGFGRMTLVERIAKRLPPGLGGGPPPVLELDATKAWPVYDWMGVAKAGLESTSRYLARYLGAEGVRVNLVAAGPLKTMAAKNIPGFEQFTVQWPELAPLGWDVADPEPAARACVALLSDWFPATTGEIVHVDGGVHAVGA